MIKKFGKTAVVCALAFSFLCVCAAASPAGETEARLELEAPLNKTLSPYTGYTREHWIEIAGRIISGFLPYFDQETGMPDFRGTDAESGHFRYTPGFTDESRNAFGRTMILTSIYSAATGRNTVPGYDGPVNGPYLKGIIRGTDPSDPVCWGPTGPYGAFGNQIAQAIMYCPQYYWDPLSQEQKKRLADWLAALVHGIGYECNCWFFNTAPVPVLKRYGYPYDYDYITEKMARVLSWYSGSGFFIDGGNCAYDYYNFWGFQMFNLYHYRYTDPWRQKFGRLIRKSTEEFMENFPYFFGSDGAPVPFGRSLTYRVAAVCPVGYAEAAGLGFLPPGQERRIASACLKHFWEGGVLSENGLVQPGWLGPNAIVAEQYCHRGAPYWIAVGFSPLLLPEDHPFWKDTEHPCPADIVDQVKVVPGAQMVLKTNRRRGEARLYPIGSPRYNQPTWQTGIKYYQHTYSSAIGWAAPGEAGPDLAQGRSGVSPDGKNWSYRTQPSPIFLGQRHNSSYYFADLGKKGYARVVTNTLIGADGEAHCVYHTYPEPLYIRVAGYGITVKHGEKASEAIDKENRILRIEAAPYESVLRIIEAPEGRFETVSLAPRAGWNHSHLFGGTAAFGQWTSSKPVPPKTLVIFYTDAARDEKIRLPEFSVRKDGLELGSWVRFEGVENLVEIF
ncbi:MAG TPA: DUF2264 domain-containing protein [archaeon]|nr:DUF2264 domain-containing protein [archaeon]